MIVALQKPSYAVEAALIGYEQMSGLIESPADVAALDLTMLGAFDEEQPAGILRYQRIADVVHLDRVAVSQAHFRRGIGRSLLEALHERESTAIRFEVSTGSANPAAIALIPEPDTDPFKKRRWLASTSSTSNALDEHEAMASRVSRVLLRPLREPPNFKPITPQPSHVAVRNSGRLGRLEGKWWIVGRLTGSYSSPAATISMARRTVRLNASAPMRRWSCGVSSSLVCERPFVEEVKIIAVGTRRAISDAS